MFRFKLFLFICFMLLTIFNIYSEDKLITITDSLSRKISLKKRPERIVLAGKAVIMLTDVLYLFPEASERVIAVGNTNQGLGNFLKVIDKNYRDKTILSKTIGAEQIAALKPDVVILKSFMFKRLGRPLEILGIPVICLGLENPEQYYRDIKILGKLFVNKKRADEISRYFKKEIDYISGKTNKLRKKPDVLVLFYSIKGGDVFFNIPPAKWMQTIQVQIAGGNPVWIDANIGKGWTGVNFEQIAVWNPDYIFIISFKRPSGEIKNNLLKNNLWKELKAVKNKNLYAFPSDYYSWAQPDVRWILGIEWLASILHFELFDYKIETKCRDFFKKMYFLDKNDFDLYISPIISGDYSGKK